VGASAPRRAADLAERRAEIADLTRWHRRGGPHAPVLFAVMARAGSAPPGSGLLLNHWLQLALITR
jgi:hypothetical protein